MKSAFKSTVLAFGVVAMLAGATAASAGTAWQNSHPRRAQVNARLANQNHRINTERREGEISKAQAQDLHAEDRGIRGEERLDASKDGGHITRAQQRRLNRQENAVSQQIGH
jgi:hypothetical protein